MTTGQPQNVEIKMAVNQERGEKVVHLTSRENAVATRSSNATVVIYPKKAWLHKNVYTGNHGRIILSLDLESTPALTAKRWLSALCCNGGGLALNNTHDGLQGPASSP